MLFGAGQQAALRGWPTDPVQQVGAQQLQRSDVSAQMQIRSVRQVRIPLGQHAVEVPVADPAVAIQPPEGLLAQRPADAIEVCGPL